MQFLLFAGCDRWNRKYHHQHQAGFLSSRSQTSVTETAVSQPPESAQRFIWAVEQLISIRSTTLLVFNSPLTASTPKACQKHTFSRPRSQYSNICVGGGPSQLLQGGTLRGAKRGNNKWKNKFNSQHASPQSFSEDIRNCSTSQINISGRNV